MRLSLPKAVLEPMATYRMGFPWCGTLLTSAVLRSGVSYSTPARRSLAFESSLSSCSCLIHPKLTSSRVDDAALSD